MVELYTKYKHGSLISDNERESVGGGSEGCIKRVVEIVGRGVLVREITSGARKKLSQIFRLNMRFK